MHPRLAPALVLTLAAVAAGCSDAGPDTGGSAEQKTTISPVAEAVPAVEPQAAAVIIKRYMDVMNKAARELDPKAAAAVQTGPALSVQKAIYGAYERNSLKAPPIRYGDGVAGAPKFTGWPRWFFAAPTDSGSKPATRDLLVFVQKAKGEPWQAAYAPYSRTTSGPIAPGVDLVDFPAVVPSDDKTLVMPPGRLAAAFADAVTRGRKSPSAGWFAAGRHVETTTKTLEANRTAFRGQGWTGLSRAVAAKANIYAARTKSGGALVWFTVDQLHSYRSTRANSGITWESPAYGDLHKAFGLPSTLKSKIARVERSELVGYIPPKGKGRIHVIGQRWVPLSITGS
jgi:hypothetical protein